MRKLNFAIAMAGAFGFGLVAGSRIPTAFATTDADWERLGGAANRVDEPFWRQRGVEALERIARALERTGERCR